MKTVLTGCMLLVMSFGFVVWVAQIVSTADSSNEEVLLKAEHDWTKAVVDRDTPFLDHILSDGFVGWDYEGKRYTKADSKHDLSSGEWATTSIRVEDINVRLYGNTAVVTSRAIRKLSATLQFAVCRRFGSNPLPRRARSSKTELNSLRGRI